MWLIMEYIWDLISGCSNVAGSNIRWLNGSHGNIIHILWLSIAMLNLRGYIYPILLGFDGHCKLRGVPWSLAQRKPQNISKHHQWSPTFWAIFIVVGYPNFWRTYCFIYFHWFYRILLFFGGTQSDVFWCEANRWEMAKAIVEVPPAAQRKIGNDKVTHVISRRC